MTLVCVFLAAAAAQAQITTSLISVNGRGNKCGDLKDVKVFLVVNGDDLAKHWFPLTADPHEDCHWTLNLHDASISTSTAHFSLRAGSKRSGCLKAFPDNEKRYANISFSCCVEGKFRNVSVTIKPPMPVSYFRYVQPVTDDGDSGTKCLESATFAEGHGTIDNTLFDLENVDLYLGPFDRKRQAPGQLYLNEIVFEDGVHVLMRDGVIYRLMVKRAKGKLQGAPTTSPNAISLDIKKLTDLKFERAEFEVIK